MLQLVVHVSVLLTLTLAASDPRAAICSRYCQPWQEQESVCLAGRDCFGQTSEWTAETRACVDACWQIGAPCRLACWGVYDACAARCEDSACFNACYDEEFDKVKPALPQ
ncbi:cysteine-rich neurotrophic factor-like [Physella acuta]|uniref:cysteine-rich neurotrophic factor-like n=1 Tax=Physella acuta TaxID=109671 RepID=UPI0027DCA8B0|nr:cysteine-rich neurotrophic factor-like [Physella acuta]XP_059153603.1 cysteine-rich neurotrophic factor-like [Physella acuta]XP_059153605.1 cysteine-rich neurotrophic factor-like [Physella acuta]